MRVIISGGGIAGLANARVLATRGWDVIVIEAASAPRRGGFMIDFFGQGWPAAEAIGVLPALRRRGRRYTAARTVDGAGRLVAELPLATFVDRGLGGRYFSLLRAEVEESLLECLPDGVELRYGRRIADVSQSDPPVEITLDDGTPLTADLLIGADGLHSGVRSMLWGAEEMFLRDLGYVTAAFTATAPELAATLDSTVELSDTIGVQLGVYALIPAEVDARTDQTGEVSCFLVAPHAGGVPADPAGWTREQLARGTPNTRSLIDHVGPDVYCDLVAQSRVPSWRRGRVLLVGDAAYAVSLLAGQGAALAIASAAALARALDAEQGLDDALARYEREFRPVVERSQRAGRRSARTFVVTSKPGLMARRLVQRAASSGIAGPLLSRLMTGAPTH